jgi:hypothetical protein
VIREIPPTPRRAKIDTAAYGVPGVQWLEVYELPGGDGAERVRLLLNGEIREFSVSEVLSWRD